MSAPFEPAPDNLARSLGVEPLSFPLFPQAEDGRLQWSRGARSLEECVQHILLTRPGERTMRTEFGAGIDLFVHEHADASLRGAIAGDVQRALAAYEPRIELHEVRVEPHPERRGRLVVSVHFSDRMGATQTLTLELVD